MMQTPKPPKHTRTPPDVVSATSRVEEHFLGALSDVLSRAIRHVIAPPSAAWRHPGLERGSASPYAEKAGGQGGLGGGVGGLGGGCLGA
jgi:hypothetical protein